MKLFFSGAEEKNVSIDLERRYRERRRRHSAGGGSRRNVSHAGVRPAGVGSEDRGIDRGRRSLRSALRLFSETGGRGLYGCGGRPNLQRCQRKYHSQNHIAARADLQSADSGVRQRESGHVSSGKRSGAGRIPEVSGRDRL